MCAENPCRNGGYCINGAKDYVCSCRPGFAGKNCERCKSGGVPTSLYCCLVPHGPLHASPHQCLSGRQLLLLVACLTSQQHASVSQGRICSDNCMCCHAETEVSHQTFCLTQSQYIGTGPTSRSPGPITPGALQVSHWSTNFKSLV